MKFEKWHGLGNDFILIQGSVKNPSSLAKKLCNRHFGIGAVIWAKQGIWVILAK